MSSCMELDEGLADADSIALFEHQCDRCGSPSFYGSSCVCRCPRCQNFGHIGVPCQPPMHLVTAATAGRLEDIVRPLDGRLRQDTRQFLATLQSTLPPGQAAGILRSLANTLADDVNVTSPPYSIAANAGSLSPTSSVASLASSTKRNMAYAGIAHDDGDSDDDNAAPSPQARDRSVAPSPEPGVCGDPLVHLPAAAAHQDQKQQQQQLDSHRGATMTLPLRPGPGAGLPARPDWRSNDDDGNNHPQGSSSSSSRSGAVDKRKAVSELAKGGAKKNKRGD